ncbi:Tm-1-like ATP-binding domain-containing protein [bacterium]|nr:Tm-1-like ATP-binding domain-containing protein [bacterium]
MPSAIALLGALDTKGAEYDFVRRCIHANGCKTLLIDVGVLDKPQVEPDVTRREVAAAAGVNLDELVQRRDRGEAVAAMSRGAGVLLPRLYQEKAFDGVLALGGTGGTSVACAAMRELPFGVPKVMVSTCAGGDVSAYVGVKDIVMIPSIVDVAGLNRISREVFARAAGAICGMCTATIQTGADRPLIAASMFGNTTPAVTAARKLLEAAGYEVLVFHCTGTGGRTMEGLVESGLISGVLDITTTEWADEIVGGVFSAGPTRLSAAARHGIPAVVVPGCVDMVNFWAPETVPARFSGRRFYPHNPNVTLMRTDVEENRRIGENMAEKLNLSTAPVTVLIPLRGVSMIDAPGGPFWWPEADRACYDALKEKLRPDIEIVEMDCNINDEAFARRCAETLLANIKAARPPS